MADTLTRLHPHQLRIRARRDVLIALRLAASSVTISKMSELTGASRRQLQLCIADAERWGYLEHDGKHHRTYWITAAGVEFQRQARELLFGEAA